jgi:hypothetical protein
VLCCSSLLSAEWMIEEPLVTAGAVLSSVVKRAPEELSLVVADSSVVMGSSFMEVDGALSRLAPQSRWRLSGRCSGGFGVFGVNGDFDQSTLASQWEVRRRIWFLRSRRQL